MSEPRYLTVEAGLLDAKHVAAMGPAVWTFLLLVQWQTDADGNVKGGDVIETAEIGDRLGLTARQVRDHFDRLELGRYIIRRRCRYGVAVKIAKPKKKLPGMEVFRQSEESPERKKNVNLDTSRTEVFRQSEEARTEVFRRQTYGKLPFSHYTTERTDISDHRLFEEWLSRFSRKWRASVPR